MSEQFEFSAQDGTRLRGLVYGTKSASAKPAIVMCHGFTGVLSALTQYAEHFEKCGFLVYLYDHRGFGVSEGLPRLHIDPHQQLSDFRDAITFVQKQDGVDPERIGVWGSSFAGGHVIVMGANDRRVKCVVSQIPYISGHENAPRLYMPDRLKRMQDEFDAERVSLASGAAHRTIPAFTSDPLEDMCVFPPVSKRFIEASESSDNWTNAVTVQSLENFTLYEPGAYAKFVSPTPLLMIVGAKDTINPPDISLSAYEEAREPKKVVIHPGGHFGTYTLQFELTSRAASDWFREHLA